MIEYCVLMIHDDEEPEVWRGPWPQEMAQEWIDEWIRDGGGPGLFVLGSREVTEWEVVK